MTIGELGADLWERVAPETMSELARRVVQHVQAGISSHRLDTAHERIFDPPVQLALLRIGPRARNSLFYLGLVHDGEVGSVELCELAQARNLGGLSLLQLLAAAEEVQPAGLAPESTSVAATRDFERRTLSRVVRREAQKLATKSWARKIRRDDVRVGADIAALAFRAWTPLEAAEIVRSALYDPAEARVKAGVIRRFVSRVNRMGRLTLESELDELLGAFTAREHQRIALRRRFGWDGSPPGTLEEAAHDVGLTRERVRQLEAKFSRVVRHAWTPTFDRALRIVEKKTFTRVVDIQRSLRDARLIDRDFPLESLLATARLFKRSAPALAVHGEMLAPADFALTSVKIEQEARRLTSHWGATTIAEIASVLAEKGETLDENIVRHALVAVPAARFLDAEEQWLWMTDSARNRLLNNVLKIMSVAGSIELGELREGVGRSHRARGFRPPRAVLARICEESGRYTVKDGRVLGKPGLPEWRDVLAENERLVADVLFHHGPVMRRDDLENLLVGERRMKRSSFYIYLTYSPILERYAAGVFGLRGARASAAEVNAMAPPVTRTQVLRDHGWTPDGQIWITYRLSKGAVTTGVVTVPSALTALVYGEFELMTDDRTSVGSVTADNGRLWGLSPFYRRRGVEVGDHLLITFGLSTRIATIEVGGSDVALRYEAPVTVVVNSIGSGQQGERHGEPDP